jgi:hypothetical protein
VKLVGGKLSGAAENAGRAHAIVTANANIATIDVRLHTAIMSLLIRHASGRLAILKRLSTILVPTMEQYNPADA